eukprot:s849_g1.t2
MLLQSKLQLRTAVDQGSSRSSFISGVDLLELRVRALEAKLERITSSSGTPWLFLPMEAVFSLIRKFGDFIGDLFLHPRGHAWQQLMVFCICTAGVVASGMSVNSQRWCEHMGGKLPSMVFGIAVGTASLAIVGSICHPVIPWMLLAVLFVLARTPKTAERVDIVSDFVSDTVTGIADGVHGMLNFATGADDKDGSSVRGAVQDTHLVKIVIAELIGAERTLGLRIENRVITAFTKPEAARFGWRLGDVIQAVARQRTPTQEVLLEKIGTFKEALRTNGSPMEFLVERLGARPN